MATASGVVQAIFPEGGLSRDGKLRPPKFGLLSYMVAAFDPKGPKDVVFVPVGVNYDRVLEDRLLTSAANTEPGKRPVFGFNLLTFLRHFFRHIWLAMRGHWYRYGYTCVSFGEPYSLKQYVAERKIDFRDMPEKERFAEVEKLGATLMAAARRSRSTRPGSAAPARVRAARDRVRAATAAHTPTGIRPARRAFLRTTPRPAPTSRPVHGRAVHAQPVRVRAATSGRRVRAPAVATAVPVAVVAPVAESIGATAGANAPASRRRAERTRHTLA